MLCFCTVLIGSIPNAKALDLILIALERFLWITPVALQMEFELHLQLTIL